MMKRTIVLLTTLVAEGITGGGKAFRSVGIGPHSGVGKSFSWNRACELDAVNALA